MRKLNVGAISSFKRILRRVLFFVAENLAPHHIAVFKVDQIFRAVVRRSNNARHLRLSGRLREVVDDHSTLSRGDVRRSVVFGDVVLNRVVRGNERTVVKIELGNRRKRRTIRAEKRRAGVSPTIERRRPDASENDRFVVARIRAFRIIRSKNGADSKRASNAYAIFDQHGKRFRFL